ncbi:Tex family protein [Ligilactobacillus aviarius]|uniref:Tex family protein n=1 Tax=Ligilactobacillus aviarius TaxID=1606 RepID=UPI0024B9691E|nr:Tex family protein [Ligilactobacillus aviarius]
MEQQYLEITAHQLPQLRPHQIKETLKLLEDGNTVPFIARYRKEMTGSLDEVQLREIQKTYDQVAKIEKRKADIISKIDEQGKLTATLKAKINQADNMQLLEDLYLPYKQKRKTKAQIAKDAGLEPLARYVLDFNFGIEAEAAKYLNPEKEIMTVDDALQGVHEIIAEAFGENVQLRDWVRQNTLKHGKIVSKIKDEEADEKGVYQLYYDFEQPISKMASHQTLALDRGEKENIIRVKIELDEQFVLRYFHSRFIGSRQGEAAPIIENAYTDAYRRFIRPAIEREIRKQLTAKADEKAINVFGDNLYHLLMQAPLKGKTVLGLDPAFRTGCKLAVIDPTGKFLAKAVIYPHEKAKGQKPNPKLRAEAKEKLKALINDYHVEMVAIGNGTASRESEAFVAEVLKEISTPVYYVIVNEAGASVYSASQIARDEFPDFNVEERSAVSIARRLQDPLAELIKIDPKSIGVGQYQHDLPEKELDNKLSQVIETGVNQVGVNLNTASPQLLEHISGLNKSIAKNIVKYRDENGKFKTRKELLNVPRLGNKAYEQSAGFLRIVNGTNPLDNTDIHPESYAVAEKLLAANQAAQDEIGTAKLNQKLKRFDQKQFAAENQIGEATLTDIVSSLEKPGRDFRDTMPMPLLRSDTLHLEDLKPGMQLQGTVRNVVDFGVFVDIGVKQDGLVHISKLSDSYVANPRDVVAVGDIVDVWVDSVDEKRGRIQLSMVAPAEQKAEK